MTPLKRMKLSQTTMSNCLLCLEACSPSSNGTGGGELGGGNKRSTKLADIGVNIVGGQNCKELVNNLEKMFILLKVLDVPKEWCEQVLQEPETRWFDVCNECTVNYVAKCWEIYQNIVALQAKMASVKEKVKINMRRGIEESCKSGRSYLLGGGTVDVQIRHLLFPDLTANLQDGFKMEALPTEEIDHNEIDEDDYDQDLSEDDISSSSSNDSTIDSDYNGHFNRRINKRKRKSPDEKQVKVNLNFKWKKCTACGSRFKHLEDYNAHKLAHDEIRSSGEFSCLSCTFPARSQQELETHQKSRHDAPSKKSYPCTKCSYLTDKWSHLKKHVESEHASMTQEELEEAGLILKCDICGGREFETIQRLHFHQSKKHPELDGMTSTSEPIECPECGVKFASSKLLQNHERSTHKRQSWFICDQCGVGFRIQSLLDHHKKSHLEKSQRSGFICDLCGLDFLGKKELKAHDAKCHSNITSKEVFKCRHCPLTSPIELIIKRHLKTHQEINHKCDHCEKTYTTARALSRHLKINHQNTGESWPCPHCHKIFSCEGYMKGHLRNNCHLKRLKMGGY